MPWGKKAAPAELSADEAAARSKALDLLTGRDYACAELNERLCRRFTPQASAAAVAAMLQQGFLDDRRYALALTRALQGQHRSRRDIARRLAARGIDRGTAEDALAECFDARQQDTGEDPDLEAAVALVERSYARRLAEGRADLVAAALARRGFAYQTIREALARCAAPGKEE